MERNGRDRKGWPAAARQGIVGRVWEKGFVVTGKQWFVRVLIGLISILPASFLADYVGGIIGWMLAGAILAPAWVPLFRSLYALSTERALRKAGKPGNS